jgi:predicted PurR-regulated permease PerM
MTLPAIRPEPYETRQIALPSGVAMSTFVAAAIVVAALYVGREVFVPIALAILFSFVLWPLVRLLRRLHFPRSVAVITVVVVAFAALTALAMVMASQATQLASDLPRYQTTMQEKIKSLRGAGPGGGVLARAADVLQELGKELDRPSPATSAASLGSSGPVPGRPVLVEVRQPEPGAMETVVAFLKPLMHPLATTGIVLIFVIFILLQREDLRNRFIRLTGTYDLQKTTAALDDAAARLSRLFVTQLVLNAAFGLVIGLGLWAIGVPSPVLWGILTAVLRFIPYIGAFFSAAFPMAIAAAVDPGWAMLAWTAALFLIAEPIAGHVIEPLVYGQSTGLSPVAIVVAATFWTWLWGPIGLVLATPLTVCLVVLGRHVERLEFLDVILGDRPALSAPEIFYQRVLAGDPAEAVDKAEEVLKERSLSAYYDEVALEGLQLAQADALRGVLDEARLERILQTIRDVVEDLSDHDDRKPSAARSTADAEAEAAIAETDDAEGTSDLAFLERADLAAAYQGEAPILLIAGRGPLDEAVALMLAQLLLKHGLGARVEPANALGGQTIVKLDTQKAALVVLCYLDATSPAHMRYAVRRLRRKLPQARLVLACVSLDAPDLAEATRKAANVDVVATSLRNVLSICLDAAQKGDAEGRSAQEEGPREVVA